MDSEEFERAVGKWREAYPDLVDWNDEFLVVRGNYLTVVTPAVAEQLLTMNTNNRRPKRTKIEQYKRDMVNLRWDADASDVKVSRSQELIDGQNRCLAAVEADMAFPTLVRTGLGLSSKLHVDTGAKRIGSDVVQMMAGERNYASGMSAAITLRSRYVERYDRYDATRGLDWKATVLTHDEMLSFLEAHPTIAEMASYGRRMNRSVTPAIQASVWVAGLSWFAEVDHAAAEDFATRLIANEFGGPGDPMLGLVQYATHMRAQVQPGLGVGGIRGRISQESNLIALIKTWNAVRAGEKLERLTVRRDERLVLPQ